MFSSFRWLARAELEMMIDFGWQHFAILSLDDSGIIGLPLYVNAIFYVSRIKP